MDIGKKFDYLSEEQKLYKAWEDSGYFNPDKLPGKRKKNWCTIMPPPNANGRLHVGHGLDVALKDALTRFWRLKGKRTLFLPGSDHAGFETQVVYEKKLEKEGRSRFQMDAQELYKEMMAFTLENKKLMEDDVRRLGSSCDWSREKFSLDEDIVEQVQQSFIQLYKDGLVYRDKRIVNWCTKHQTSLSEVETEFIEQADPFYYFQYGPFVIGTSRPETKFGDKYVVMHPDDERYKEYHQGQQIELEWINGPIRATVIKDEAVDREFGSGVMTITPWHDQADFEIAQKHNLDKEQIIDERGKLLPIAGELSGMKIFEAREKIVAKLKEKGLLVKVDERYTHAVKVCYKCQRPIEPQISEQWFVKMKPLAEKALKAVEKGKIKFLPENQEKIFRHWMENTIDWNISRQIVWGIRIPAWYKDGEVRVGKDSPGELWREETDVFDTWFSSGQWPYLVLGYPKSSDFKDFYPTDVMETGADLVFKWVPRMIFFSEYFTKKEPFKVVYFHGMIHDEKGKKMSKSKGNVLSPVDLAEEFGTDALRMALLVGNPAGSNMALSKDKIKAYRNFSTKIWNAARFVLMNFDESLDRAIEFSESDQKILEAFKEQKERVALHIEEFKLHLAAEEAYHYFWHTFADKIIEENKGRLQSEDKEEKARAQSLLLTLLKEQLIMLHPFMPFITEALYQKLPLAEKKDFLMVEEW